MNALDKAFIQAYAKGTRDAAATVIDRDEPGPERTAAATQNRATMEVARLSPLVEVSTADGVWYRIEQAPAPGVAAVAATQLGGHDHRAGRILTEAMRAAVESNLSAAEMLDAFLGLHAARAATPPRGGPQAAFVRVDAPHPSFEAHATAAAQAETALEPELTPAELRDFTDGAAASVIAEVWDTGLLPENNLESLCQCWIAGETLAAPVIVEETWTAPAPCSVEAPSCEAAPIAEVTPAAPPAAPAAAPVTTSSPAVETPVAKTTDHSPTAAAPASSRPAVASAPAPLESQRAAPVELPKPRIAFQAAWEVDRFNWPDECDKLARGDAFGPVAKTLVETSRRGVKVVAITGIRRGEGRTTLALCLARRAAQEGVRVALIDADFECPHLGRRIGIDMENGWDDVLTDSQPLSEAAVSSLEDQLTVLPLGRRAAAFVSAHTVTALQQASAVFDLVLVDMGPVRDDEPCDPAGDGPSSAAALVVSDRRSTTEADISLALDRLHAAGIETLGIVETFA